MYILFIKLNCLRRRLVSILIWECSYKKYYRLNEFNFIIRNLIVVIVFFIYLLIFSKGFDKLLYKMYL